MSRLATAAVLAVLGQAAAANLASAMTTIASDDFDAPLNLVSYSAIDDEGNDPTNSGVWSSGFDNFGPRSMQDNPGPGPTGNFLSDAVVDNSVADPADTIGVLTPDYPGRFFAIVDTDNGANPSGLVTGTWVFDISNAASLDSFEVDMGVTGFFFDNGSIAEQFTWAYSIDGGPATDLIEVTGNAAAGPVTYTLANGSQESFDVAVTANGALLDNNLTTLSAPLTGSGSQLSLTLTGFINDNNAALVADNIRILGTPVPEPGSCVLLASAVACAATGFRRR